jgi:tryptophan-rich sensory protein
MNQKGDREKPVMDQNPAERRKNGSRRDMAEGPLSFGIILFLVVLAASFGAVFRPGPWYEALNKPAFTPPGWIFSPVWAALYLMIAVAGWLAWRNAADRKHPAIVLWASQLALNALWSWIFFGLENPGLALLDIVVLLLLILAFAGCAFPVSRSASLLFVPYALWVGFAAYLNLGIVLLN